MCELVCMGFFSSSGRGTAVTFVSTLRQIIFYILLIKKKKGKCGYIKLLEAHRVIF